MILQVTTLQPPHGFSRHLGFFHPSLDGIQVSLDNVFGFKMTGKHRNLAVLCDPFLVGGFNPFEKYSSKWIIWIISPRIGVKIKNV